MAISQKSIKILWANAAGYCSFPDCPQKLALSETGEFAAHTIGEMAHICGENPGSNRHDLNQTTLERDDYSNLILLCPTHHTIIDRKENEARFSVALLLQMKADHEAFVQRSIGHSRRIDRKAAASLIAPLLEENHQAWLSFGPLSDVAKQNPHSAAAHAAWLSERLGTIVPNNRRIAKLLTDEAESFHPQDQSTIAAFLLHARSYEQWVSGSVSYEGVRRFPTPFADLIKEAVRAGS